MKKFFPVLLTCFIFQAAFAQSEDAAAETDESLDFVITAGRTREAANKVNGQLTVITADDIAESGATTITGVLQKAPGIRLARDRNGNGVDLSMRGISSDYGNGKVLVIVDGMRLNQALGRATLNWGAINLSDVERIEILDGGASVQYGDNAQAGVINIITKQSVGGGGARTDIVVSGGSFFQNEQRFSHHRPTNWGGFTVSGGHQGTQGYQKHTASDTGNAELRGTFDIDDTMSLQANLGFAAANGLFANGLTQTEFDDDPTQNKGFSADGFSSTDLNAGLGFIWAINENASFELPVSYSWKDIKWDMHTYNYVSYRLPQMIGLRPKITAEMKAADMSLRFTGGVDALFAFSEVKSSNEVVEEINFHIQNLSETTIGPWVLVNFEPVPFLALNAGLRYDTAFFKAHFDEWTGTVAGTPKTVAAVDESKRWDAFVYEAGLTVNPVDFLKVYAKYGTQFKYPYLDDLIVFNPGNFMILPNTGLEAEKGWTVEGGIGVNFKEFVKFDANLYYFKIDNEIAVYPIQGLMVRTSANMDPIERLGTDIGLTVTPVKYVELDMDYGFVNAEFSEGPLKGNFVPLVAKHTLSASLMLRLPFGLSVGPDVIYKSAMYQGLDIANAQPVIDPSLIWGLQARYVINKFNGELALQLTVHNLAGTKYASMVYYTPPAQPGGQSSTMYYVDPNMGRSVNISLQYRF